MRLRGAAAAALDLSMNNDDPLVSDFLSDGNAGDLKVTAHVLPALQSRSQ